MQRRYVTASKIEPLELPPAYKEFTELDKPTRYVCPNPDCGDTEGKFYVTRVQREGRIGWLYHCFKCAPRMSSFCPQIQVAPPSETVKSFEQKKVEQKGGEYTADDFPADRTGNLPIEAKNWLKKYGITEGEQAMFDIKYSANRGRLIMPVYDCDDAGDVLLRWEERALNNTYQPKVISRIVAPFPNKLEVVNGAEVVVVEDFISAIKVSRICSAYCLHGSHISNEDINQLRDYEIIYVWLDDDKHEHAWRLVNRMNALGLTAKLINTALDPKCYHTEEIDEFIETAYHRSGMPV